MRFAHPEVLWLILLLPLLGLFAWLRLRAGYQRLAGLLSPSMTARLVEHLAPERKSWKLITIIGALLCLILAAAQPQRGTQYITATRQGVDVIVALDLSESMLAEDLLPNRLLRARHEISGIIDQLKGDRIGLIAFAGAAFVQCPLTLDYSAARMFLEFMGPDLIPEPGTSIAEAIRVATGAYNSEEGDFKALILITDGEDHIGEIAKAAKEARSAGVKVFTVGIGSESGEPIPERDAEGEITGYKKDNSGKVILTRLNEEALRLIADETGGIYTRAGGTLGLDRVATAIDAMEKRELEGGVRMLYEERYNYFLWPALFLLMIAWAIPLRRRWGVGPGQSTGSLTRSALRNGSVLSISLLMVLSMSASAQNQSQGAQSLNPQHQISPSGSGGTRAPNQATGPSTGTSLPGGQQMMPGAGGQAPEPQMPEEEWVKLLEENQIYRNENPADPRPIYNLGNLFHLKGDLPEAEEFYGIAASRAEGDLASNITYNLGNTLARAGKLEEARSSFAESLFLNPANEDAKYNLELVQKMLDQAQQCPDSTCQQNQENQDQQDNQDNQNDQNQDNQDQGDQQDQQEQQDQQDQENQSDEEQQDQDRQDQEEQGEDQEEEQNQSESQEEDESENQPEEQSAADQGESPPDSAMSAEDMQLMQILKGLESSEKELLETRFQARGKNLKVAKDW